MGDGARWHSYLLIQAIVVAHVDENLRAAAIGPGGGKRDSAREITLLHRVVLDLVLAKFLVITRALGDAPLSDETGHDTIELAVGEVSVLDELLETPAGEREKGEGEESVANGSRSIEIPQTAVQPLTALPTAPNSD